MTSMRNCRFQLAGLVVALQVVMSSSLGAATIEHWLTVDPDFTHVYQYEPEDEVSRMISTLRIPVPTVTLAAGDVHRVTVEFSHGQSLLIAPSPTDGYVDHRFNLIDANIEERAGRGAGGVGGRERIAMWGPSLRLISEDSWPSSSHYLDFFEDTVRWTQLGTGFLRGPEHNDLPVTVRRFMFELTAPTALREGDPPDAPYLPTTFTDNRVVLEFVSHRVGDEALEVAPGVTIVPEPGTMWLLGAAALGCATRARRSPSVR